MVSDLESTAFSSYIDSGDVLYIDIVDSDESKPDCPYCEVWRKI